MTQEQVVMQFTLTEGKLRDKRINVIFVRDMSAFKTKLQFMTVSPKKSLLEATFCCV